MYRPSSYSSTGGGYRGDPYEEDRYGSRSGGRDDDRNGYGKEKEWDRYRDDDRYGRNGDSYGKDGDRYSRDGGERYSRDGERYRDDEYGVGKDNEEDRYGSRKGDRSYEKEKDHSYEDDDRYSSRSVLIVMFWTKNSFFLVSALTKFLISGMEAELVIMGRRTGILCISLF